MPCVFEVTDRIAEEEMQTHQKLVRRREAEDRAAQIKAALYAEKKRADVARHRQEEEQRRLAASELEAILEIQKIHMAKYPVRSSPLENRTDRRKPQKYVEHNVKSASSEYHPRSGAAPQPQAPRQAQRLPPPPTTKGPRKANPPIAIRLYPDLQIQRPAPIPQPRPQPPQVATSLAFQQGHQPTQSQKISIKKSRVPPSRVAIPPPSQRGPPPPRPPRRDLECYPHVSQ
ncbi:hypothetical protein H0H81_004412 [Sphagnurus paluster]|uniref:Uncharacterized protein n=1 Tax=Sphagnurus paluster TaxID=117069 RepID=A0A9P7FUV9_9AGAR|nr:hypothetical protein H0H81_004412 [Sphagnurus paluster]